MSEDVAPGVDESRVEGGQSRKMSGEAGVSTVADDSGRLKRLEAEADVAADYLEEFLDIADVDGDIDLDIEGDRSMVAVVGTGLDHLIGPSGEVLEALQELTRLAVYRETGERSRLMLDVGAYRARRRREVVTSTEAAVAQVRGQGDPIRMDPMPPFERKVAHDVVAEAGLVSESEGEDPERRVIVRPAS